MSRREDIISKLAQYGPMNASQLAESIYGVGSKQSTLAGYFKIMLEEGTIIKIGERPAIYSLPGEHIEIEPQPRAPRQPRARAPRQQQVREAREIAPLGETISVKIGRFYNLIRNYQEGGPNTRYKSWEWCHKAFLESKEEYRGANEERKNKIVEYLSLHLAFYLASWGMYRGSSYLLQRDYKAHKNAVRFILEDRYDLLWDYVPTQENIDDAADLIFDRNNGIYYRIKNSYSNYEGNDDDASDTLTTKILMGTFGCVPAFDRFLKKGIGNYKKNHYPDCGMTQSIEKSCNTFKALARFAINSGEELHFEAEDGFAYPIMKCVDMFFWESGYELDIADNLIEHDVSNHKKEELLNEAIGLDICNPGLTYEQASAEIKRRN